MFKMKNFHDILYPVHDCPKAPSNLIVEHLKSKNLEKLMVTWVEGAVQLYRGGKLVKEVKNFNPVAIKNHSHTPSKSSWCWEYSFREITDLQKESLDTKLPFRGDRAKYYTYYVGVRPTKFLEMYNACMMKAFIPQDLRDEDNKYCRERLGRFNPSLIKVFINNANHFRQMKVDGMGHMIPLFLKTPKYNISGKVMNVTEFRKAVGKSAWKSLLKNSHSRNKLIAHNLGRHYHEWGYNYDLGSSVKHLNQLPSGMIPTNILHPVPDIESVSLFRKLKIVGDRIKQREIGQYIRDSKNMTEQLGRKLPKGNSSWSFDQWKEYHEKVTELITLKKFSKDVFEWTKNYPTEFRSNNYTAKLLDNAFDIKMEGDTMKHCVASYSKRSSEGDYMVIGILDKNGRRYSTLGLQVTGKGLHFNQHYRNCNASVKCEEAKTFAEDITKQLNKEWRKISQSEKGELDVQF